VALISYPNPDEIQVLLPPKHPVQIAALHVRVPTLQYLPIGMNQHCKHRAV